MRLWIITWTLSKDGVHSSDYLVTKDIQTARRKYDTLLEYDDLYAASISAVVESTDYDTHPSLKVLNRGFKQGGKQGFSPQEYHEMDVVSRLHDEEYLDGYGSKAKAWRYIRDNRELIEKCRLEGLNPFDTIDIVERHNKGYVA